MKEEEEEIMNFDDKLEFMDFLHESIIQHLQDCDSSELNSLLSNYVEVVMNLSMDLCKTEGIVLDNTDNSVSKRQIQNSL